MPLLDRTGWAADPWSRDNPGDSRAIVALDALEAALAGRRPGQEIGVDLPNDAGVAALDAHLGALDLVAIAFPAFTDGRGFSLARALRGAGYAGRLRAVGELLPDQFAFALQCGFDEVEIGDARVQRQPLFQWLEALGSISDSYQDGPVQPSILARRSAAA